MDRLQKRQRHKELCTRKMCLQAQLGYLQKVLNGVQKDRCTASEEIMSTRLMTRLELLRMEMIGDINSIHTEIFRLDNELKEAGEACKP